MAKRQSLNRPVALKEVLQGVIRPGDWEILKQRRQIREVWEAVLPPSLLAQTRLVDFRRKELLVEVSASPWVQELQFMKPAILQEMDRVLGAGAVKELRFRLGEGF
jgi:predicted nucleic acid-binding Zn ribbon protein